MDVTHGEVLESAQKNIYVVTMARQSYKHAVNTFSNLVSLVIWSKMFSIVSKVPGSS